jgi:hypothetical protein
MKTMLRIKALSLTQGVNDWLTNSRHPRILHIFDDACNLINEHQAVISIVISQIGNGPFNLVVENNVLFSEQFNKESQVSIPGTQLTVGDLTINTENAKLWNPRPDWEMLHSKRDEIAGRFVSLHMPVAPPEIPDDLLTALAVSIVSADIPSAVDAAKHLAGLGVGLTPAGDDVLMGALYAAWLIHPREVASELAEEIVNTAAPLTTSLSAAWLNAAARGQAGITWHALFGGLIAGDEARVQQATEEILATGETSGADALSGFLGVMKSYIASFSRKAATSSDE